MKNFKKVLALVLVLATLLGLATMASATEYKDADKISADYTEAVKVLDLIETMQGYPNGEFKPTANITREEAAKLIAIFDNKDADISTYYTSINPFADEKGRWGESYVGYGYRAGIIAGMNATTFAPTANVTGTQFLKMALVTLGYDQEAEGFVGSSWAVNVLALARKLDLIDGLADGWKAEKDLTREEAAQILLNTLKADTVEYAQEAKQVGFKPTAKQNGTDWTYTWNGRIYLTVAGAVKTGNKLYKDFGLKTSTSFDAFNRPYTKWTKGKDSVEVMKAPKATFTTRFSACDLLAELGVEKTDKKTNIVVDYVWCDGEYDGDSVLLKGGNGTDYTLKADAGFEVAYSGKTFTSIDKAHGWGIWHHTDSTCAVPSAAEHGAQGTLTQVFEMGKDSAGNKHYYVCSIETWLAKVDSVTTKTTSRDEHTKAEGSVKIKEVYTETADLNASENFHSYRVTDTGHDEALKAVINALKAQNKKLTYDDPTGISKGDYVLLTYSFKSGEVESLDVVEGKEGKLNGHKYGKAAENPSETRIDGEFIKDAVHFSLGYNESKSNAYDTYTFFYDAYGNVIGMKDSADASGWGVADRMWIGIGEKGAITFNADIVGLDGETKTAQIKTKTTSNLKGEDYAYDVATWIEATFGRNVNGLSYKDFTQYYDHLYKFSTDSKGNFTWNESINKANGAQLKDGSTSYKVQHFGGTLADEAKISGKAYIEFNGTYGATIYGKTGTSVTAKKVSLTDDTQFLVHNMDGTYDEYTGYKNVPAMIAHYVEFVMDDDNNYAEVVYLTKDVYTTDSKFIAYVGAPADTSVVYTDNEHDYFYLGVYVAGEYKDVMVKDDDVTDYFSKGTSKFKPGIYQFQYMKVDGDEIVTVAKTPSYTTTAAKNFTGNNEYLGTPKTLAYFENNQLRINVAGQVNADGNVDDKTYVLTDETAFYGINRDGEIVEVTKGEIEADMGKTVANENKYDTTETGYQAHQIFFQINDNEEVTALYYVLAKND